MLTAPGAVRLALLQRQIRHFRLVYEILSVEFADLPQHFPNAAVVADAAEGFTYKKLKRVFQLIMDGAPLMGIGRNRDFRQQDKLLLDASPFFTSLKYACYVEAEILGKSAKAFFQAAVETTGVKGEEVLRVGDDAFTDVEGALANGLRACLMQTGKYSPGDEDKIRQPGAWLCASI